ncbi:NDR1/HIN1-like protein 10 [Lolium rigidum]|uniref:NDR1/HIN1-like protein 10 n=1 Tax=Lolium rigidum TaxID=89674 RepID=UPI001F5D0969|nr:NDR1/HIN1-like protein 10 [Lolium rigidum]
MATHEHKIDHLDQGYDGPTIPHKDPPTQRRIPCVAVPEPYALLCTAFRALTFVLIAVGVVALVLSLVFQLLNLKAYVDSAMFTRFDLGTGGNGTSAQLNYNLTVALSIRNLNPKRAVVYRSLEAVALYAGERFGYMSFPQMRQERKNTMEIRPSFDGQSPVAAAASAASKRDKGEGFFSINVKVYTRVRLNVAIVNSVVYSPDVDCYVTVPNPGNSTAVAQGFAATECHVDDCSLLKNENLGGED